ncbi:MAG: hypothetical protein ACR2OX_01295 [Methyloligellaceae bacterium]
MIVLVLVSTLVFILINNQQVYEFVQEKLRFGGWALDLRVFVIFLIISILLIYAAGFFRKHSNFKYPLHRNLIGTAAATIISAIFIYFLWRSLDYGAVPPDSNDQTTVIFRFVNWGFVYLSISLIVLLYLVSVVIIFCVPEEKHILAARIYAGTAGLILALSIIVFDDVEVFTRITVIGLAILTAIIFISILDVFYTLRYPNSVFLQIFLILGFAFFAFQLLDSGEQLHYDFDGQAAKREVGKDYVDYAKGLIAMPPPDARKSDQIASIAIRVEKVQEKALDRYHSLALSRGIDSVESDFLEYLKSITPKENARSPIDVVLVSAEGGGLYAAYQAAMTLAALSDYCAQFHRKIFAIGATSGGSVGAALFTSLLEDARRAGLLEQKPAVTSAETTSLCERRGSSDTLKNYVRKIFDHDFLTPTLAGFILGDLPKILFFGRGLTDDRAVSFRKSLERAYENVRAEIMENAKDKKLDGDAPMKQLFFGDGSKTVFPRLFFQSTLVETGQLVVIGQSFLNSREFRDLPDKVVANVKQFFVDRNLPPDETDTKKDSASDEIEDLTNSYGELSFDFNHVLEVTPELDPSVAEAASVSARFPIITPSKHVQGKHIVEGDRPVDAKFVDGGYFDNKGLSSMLYVLMRLKRLLLEAGVDHHVKFHMLNIVNSKSAKLAQPSNNGLDPSQNCRQRERPEGLFSFAPILLDPIQAIYNTNRAKEENISSKIRDLLVEPVEVSIDKLSGSLPLTWYLSKEAREIIDDELGIDGLTIEQNEAKGRNKSEVAARSSDCSKRVANEDAFQQFLGLE